MIDLHGIDILGNYAYTKLKENQNEHNNPLQKFF